MHSRTRQEWNVSLRAGWFKSPSHLNKGPLCELKFFLYSSFVPPTHLSLTHLWSMTVTRSLGKSVSFLGSANSLIACTSLGLACGGRQERIDVTCRKVRRLSGIFMRQEQQSLLWFFFKWKGQEKLQTSATIALSWAKLGLSAALHAQHFRITVYSSRGQSGGFSRRSPSRSTRHNI